MNKNLFIILGIVLLLVAGVGWYTSHDRGSDEVTNNIVNNEESMQSNEDVSSVDMSGSASIASLMNMGREITCSFSYTEESGESGEGTGYFTESHMRIDSQNTINGEFYDSHIISDGENLYMWTAGGEGEFAMMVPTPEEFATEGSADGALSGPSGQSQVDMDQNVQYECEAWSADGSVFVPPSDIEFMDMSDMMNSMPGGMPPQ